MVIACENICFSSLFAAGDVSRGGTYNVNAFLGLVTFGARYFRDLLEVRNY